MESVPGPEARIPPGHDAASRQRDIRRALIATIVLWIALVITPPQPYDSSDSSIEWPAGLDKIVHALLFAAETFFLHRALRHLKPPQTALLLAMAGALVLGAVTEAWQTLIPVRHGDPADLAANVVGILAAGLVITGRQS